MTRCRLGKKTANRLSNNRDDPQPNDRVLIAEKVYLPTYSVLLLFIVLFLAIRRNGEGIGSGLYTVDDDDSKK